MTAKNLKAQPLPQKAGFKPPYAAVILIAVFAAQCFRHAASKSATYDEVGHITASYLICKTDYGSYDIEHPTFIRRLFAVPLLFMDISLPIGISLPEMSDNAPITERSVGNLLAYGKRFLYANTVKAGYMLFASRAVNIFLASLLGLLVFFWSKSIFGMSGGLLSLALFSFCPNIIAHGSLVTTDLGGTLFATLFLYAFSLLTDKDSSFNVAFTGIALGLALLSKMSNVVFVPLFLAMHVLFGVTRKKSFMKIIKQASAALFLSWIIVCAGYRFADVFSPHVLQEKDVAALSCGKVFSTLYKHAPLPENFLQGVLSAVYHNKRGHGSYLFGRYSSYGWIYYFPAAFLVKTPSITIFLVLLWFLCFIKILPSAFKPEPAGANITATPAPDEIIIFIALALFAGISMAAKLNIGIRHILLLYPLLYILAGRLALLAGSAQESSGGILDRMFLFAKKKTVFVSSLLLFLLAAEVFSVAPDYIAFFNIISGGPGRGSKYLSDSNIDWGQDLNSLAAYIKSEGNPELILCYFGTASPEYYGLQYQGLLIPSTHVNSLNPAKEYLAVSVTNLLGTYFVNHDIFGWLNKKQPLRKIGYSIYVYDITNDLESQNRIMELYRMAGDPLKFMRQSERAKRLLAARIS